MPINVNTTDFPKLMAQMVASARAGQSSGGGGGGRGPVVMHGGGGGGSGASVQGSLGGTASEKKSDTNIGMKVDLDPFLRLLGYKTQDEMMAIEKNYMDLINNMSDKDAKEFMGTSIFQNLAEAHAKKHKATNFYKDRETGQWTLPRTMIELRMMNASPSFWTSGAADRATQDYYGKGKVPEGAGGYGDKLVQREVELKKTIPPEEAAMRQAQTRAAEFETQRNQYLLEQEKQFGPQERENRRMVLEAQIQEHKNHSMAYEHQGRLARIQADQLEKMEHPKVQQALENTKRLYYGDLEQADKNNSLQLMQGEGKLTGETKWGVVNSYFNVHDRAWRSVDSTFASEQDKSKMSLHARPYVDSALVRLEHAFYQQFPSSTKEQLKESGNRQVFLEKAVNMVRGSQQSGYNSSGDINNWDSLIMLANLAFHTAPPSASQEKRVNLIVNTLQLTGISSEATREAIWRWQERYKKLGPPTLYEDPKTPPSQKTMLNEPAGYGMTSDPMVQFGPGYRDPNKPMGNIMPGSANPEWGKGMPTGETAPPQKKQQQPTKLFGTDWEFK